MWGCYDCYYYCYYCNIIMWTNVKGQHIIIKYYVSFLFQGTNSLLVQLTTSRMDNHTRLMHTSAVSKSRTHRKLSRTMSDTFLWILPHARPFSCIFFNNVIIYFDLFIFFRMERNILPCCSRGSYFKIRSPLFHSPKKSYKYNCINTCTCRNNHGILLLLLHCTILYFIGESCSRASSVDTHTNHIIHTNSTRFPSQLNEVFFVFLCILRQLKSNILGFQSPLLLFCLQHYLVLL